MGMCQNDTPTLVTKTKKYNVPFVFFIRSLHWPYQKPNSWPRTVVWLFFVCLFWERVMLLFWSALNGESPASASQSIEIYKVNIDRHIQLITTLSKNLGCFKSAADHKMTRCLKWLWPATRRWASCSESHKQDVSARKCRWRLTIAPSPSGNLKQILPDRRSESASRRPASDQRMT